MQANCGHNRSSVIQFAEFDMRINQKEKTEQEHDFIGLTGTFIDTGSAKDMLETAITWDQERERVDNNVQDDGPEDESS